MQEISTMRVGSIAMKLQCCVAALALSAGCLTAVAQEGHSHGQQAQTAAQQAKTNALIQAVQRATARFQDPAVAGSEGYALQFGCVSGDSAGAMGLHYVNGYLVNQGVIDVAKPQ